MNFLVALDCLITVNDADEAEADSIIEAHLDEVMEELGRLSAGDPSIDLDLTCGQVAFSVLVHAPNPLEAVDQASGLVRSAIHAAGGATPNWPDRMDKAWAVQLVAIRSEPVSDARETDEEPELTPV